MESQPRSFMSLLLSALLSLTGATALADTSFAPFDSPDAVTARVEFEVNVMGFIPVRGRFDEITAARADAAPGADRSMDFSVPVDSVDTQNPGRDAFLRSSAFFDAARFPTIRFAGKRVVYGDDGDALLLGDLTLHGTTRRVTFTLATAQTAGDASPPAGEYLAARTTIRRDEFGLDTFAMPVSNEVEVRVYVTGGFTTQRLSRTD